MIIEILKLKDEINSEVLYFYLFNNYIIIKAEQTELNWSNSGSYDKFSPYLSYKYIKIK